MPGESESESENGDEHENTGGSDGRIGRGPPADRTPREVLEFGVINLDKPPGPSAHQVSGWVREMVAEGYGRFGASGAHGIGDQGIDRAAHTGTLDPTVTGCLPVLTGRATRLSGALLTPKEYVAVLETHERLPADFDGTIQEFLGPIYQKPPRKSAVTRQLRVREIYGLDVLDTETRRALLRIRCESGTYVRKLCHDLGLALGTGAHMGHLRRTRAEPFDDSDLVTLQDLADALAIASEGNGEKVEGIEAGGIPPLTEVVQPAERALTHLPRLTIAHSAAREVANGAPVYAPGVLGYEAPAHPLVDTATGESNRDENDRSDTNKQETDRESLVACYTPDGAVVCLGELVGDPEAERGTVLDTERVLV